MDKDKSTIDLLDYFAAHALSGYYSREGIGEDGDSIVVAEKCYEQALDMVKVRQDILDTVEGEMTVDSEGKLRRK
tara:strand:- start:365 stop:589 length:225 start_codon:yes stop_codon:yes gene_type:complete